MRTRRSLWRPRWARKYSPDLNAIEAWWNAFRQRLDEQAPAEAETLAQFLLRLRRTVIWMNVRWQQAGKRLCRGQKKRAKAVLRLGFSSTLA